MFALVFYSFVSPHVLFRGTRVEQPSEQSAQCCVTVVCCISQAVESSFIALDVLCLSNAGHSSPPQGVRCKVKIRTCVG